MHESPRIRLIIICLFALVAFDCASTVLMVAPQPFVVADAPADLRRLPLRVAIVRTPALNALPAELEDDDAFGKKLTAALLRGMQAAASLTVQTVDITDDPPAGAYDLVVFPTNPYFEIEPDRERHWVVTMTLEVIVRDAATGQERALLIEATGPSGKRPVVTLQMPGTNGAPARTVGVMGAPIQAGRFTQAINNALFYLSLDFAEKFHKRVGQLRGAPAP
jgi:hypothetical protein